MAATKTDKKKGSLRVVKPGEKSVKEKFPVKTVALTAIVSAVAGGVVVKLLDMVWEKGKKALNPDKPEASQNPMLPGMPQTPYAQFLAMQHGTMPPAASPNPMPAAVRPAMTASFDEPPAWFAQFKEQYERDRYESVTMTEDLRAQVFKQLSTRLRAVDEDEDAA